MKLNYDVKPPCISAGGLMSGDSKLNGCYHISILSDTIRIQVNAGDTCYIKNRKEIKQIIRWLEKAIKIRKSK